MKKFFIFVQKALKKSSFVESEKVSVPRKKKKVHAKNIWFKKGQITNSCNRQRCTKAKNSEIGTVPKCSLFFILWDYIFIFLVNIYLWFNFSKNVCLIKIRINNGKLNQHIYFYNRWKSGTEIWSLYVFFKFSNSNFLKIVCFWHLEFDAHSSEWFSALWCCYYFCDGKLKTNVCFENFFFGFQKCFWKFLIFCVQ